MSESKNFTIGGVEVSGLHIGGGMWVGVPKDQEAAMKRFLTGSPEGMMKAMASALTGMPLGIVITPGSAEVKLVEERCECEAPKAKDETIQAYRHRNGISKTQMAKSLGISRRSLGRWEEAGRKMSEV